MKKKRPLILILACAAALGALVWWNLPVGIKVPKAAEIGEITVFDGGTGKTLHITEEREISQVIETLSTVKLKKDKLSVGYMGYSLRLTIYLKNGEEAGGWNGFIINGEDFVRKAPFFYRAVDGTTGYGYLCTLLGK